MKQLTNLSIGILAGGKSSRMGQNKALLKINNESIIKRLTDELGHISAPIISAASKGVYEEISNKVVYDQNKEIGPIEGIRQVLLEATDDYVFVCAADMPFITKELVDYMASFISSDYDCYVINDGKRIQPLCAIYSKKLLLLIEELISKGEYKLYGIISNSRTKFIDLEYTVFDSKVVKNINTKEEYIEAIKPLCFAVSGYKNTGKTGLIEKLINEFINDGLKVATIKHDGHNVLEDVPGTDTYRFLEAGVVASGAITDTRGVLNINKSLDVKKLIERIKSDVSPDVIILEGFKHSDFAKVEIVRRDVHPKSVCDNLICIATYDSLDAECDVYNINDTSGIFLCIKKYFGLI